MKFYRYFLNGIPEYLARHYWWAYLWRFSVWFFDFQFIINAILFGQYKKLKAETLLQITDNKGPILQLACVYGSLTPTIIKKISPMPLHITDVALIQLRKIKNKIARQSLLLATIMNAEQLAYKNNSFKKLIVFFLLHELPQTARLKTLAECLRVTQPDGIIVITEYNKKPINHFLYRFYPSRWLLEKAEPFLSDFWSEDLFSMLNDLGKQYAKEVNLVNEVTLFYGFYRVVVYSVCNRDIT
ncbi:hypothetical protein MNBD_GAMMA22-221 [hydrothermal vent metagenome]|uniref:Methyltransferase domain-containing protein n=1 Tax=hydrothermal vent metagenome TaxID=652676 RepID=A0A3B0ZGZ6_9ZZZZ